MSPEVWKNKKNGKLYRILYYSVINTTNAQDGQKMVVYENMEGQIFVREQKEFYEKFEEVK